MRTGLIAALMAIGMAAGIAAQTQPLLQLQEQPYSCNSVALIGTVGGQRWLPDGPVLGSRGSAPLTAPETEGSESPHTPKMGGT